MGFLIDWLIRMALYHIIIFAEMKHLYFSILLLAAVAISGCSLSSCKDKRHDEPLKEAAKPVNAVYYWKTVFQLDTTDLRFMQRHNIRRIYLRMFDVVPNDNELFSGNKSIPNASVRFEKYYDFDPLDSIEDLEITPTVYITLEALKAEWEEDQLATKIVNRVKNMASYNHISDYVRELQLDCDWTEDTEYSFFQLCREVREKIDADSLEWGLSSTIRLHQLRKKAPPVDRGVLMLYNTGSFKNPDSHNSILDIADVKPYLKHINTYPLQLDCAYPTYSWNLIFHEGKFNGIFRGDIKRIDGYSKASSDNVIRVANDTIIAGKLLQTGDLIRTETSPFSTIKDVKILVDKAMIGKPHSNILYHFDSDNLSDYSYDEIKTIFN